MLSTSAPTGKLKHLPPMETLADGCCQKPAFGEALYLANLQKARESKISRQLMCPRTLWSNSNSPLKMPSLSSTVVRPAPLSSHRRFQA